MIQIRRKVVNKMKKANKNWTLPISTPLWAYAIILILLLLFGCIGFVTKTKPEFCKNMFYAIVGSLIVSLMIDMGATALRKKADEEKLNFISSKFDALCEGLNKEIELIASFTFFYKQAHYTTYELINTLLIPTGDYGYYWAEINFMNSLYRAISDLNMAGSELQRSLVVHCDNMYFDKAISERIDKIVEISTIFCRKHPQMGRKRGRGQRVNILPYGEMKETTIKLLDSVCEYSSVAASNLTSKVESGTETNSHPVGIVYSERKSGKMMMSIDPENFDISRYTDYHFVE